MSKKFRIGQSVLVRKEKVTGRFEAVVYAVSPPDIFGTVYLTLINLDDLRFFECESSLVVDATPIIKLTTQARHNQFEEIENHRRQIAIDEHNVKVCFEEDSVIPGDIVTDWAGVDLEVVQTFENGSINAKHECGAGYRLKSFQYCLKQRCM